MGRRRKDKAKAKAKTVGKAKKPDRDDPNDSGKANEPADGNQNQGGNPNELAQEDQTGGGKGDEPAQEDLNLMAERILFSQGVRGAFLCDIPLSPYDIKSGKLLVPHEAAQYFSTKSNFNTGFYKREVRLCEITKVETWPAILMHCAVNPPRPILFGCKAFFERHGVRAGETFRFFRPQPPTYGIDYAIELAPRGYSMVTWRGELIWRRVLTADDIMGWRFDIPLEIGRVLVGGHAQGTEELQFTDSYGIDWLMNVLYLEGFQSYVIFSGWEHFVKKYDLKMMDDVKIYRALTPLHPRHFIIDYGRREKYYY